VRVTAAECHKRQTGESELQLRNSHAIANLSRCIGINGPHCFHPFFNQTGNAEVMGSASYRQPPRLGTRTISQIKKRSPDRTALFEL
jgi:hypothetical protein